MRRARRKLIKICGLTTEQDVRYASTFLPDLAGFVLFFPKSKRNLEIDRAIKLKESLDKKVKSVAVVVSPSVEQVEIIQTAGFDYIQIHGSLAEEVYDAVHIPILRAFNVSDMNEFTRMQKLDKIEGYIFDSHDPGSGSPFDWSLLEQIQRDDRLLFLAGGIHEGNVQEAMIRVNPDGIDVSSAVEYIKPDSGGINGGQDRYPDEGGRCAGEEKKIIKTRGKDPEKMKRIIRMVHSYEQ
ncbi:MAG TPA: phosphoribosylanthranilate isomerase [Candidatus Anaerobutyricum stercoris]|uniref:N-(5'-phosphoribosyl)anthranilate isomerase n=1 Tax=Candidatus Anaerobutyricum stercoris TaxID=2838457 RepID=A0A9D2EL24_9FIRM|nr:phosphoribosylanthranilate isomerase [Candidatus Anaerobutyricum stercoris]